MALSEARRASLLAYCRIEEPTAEELLTLEGLYDAAVGYLEQAGVSEPEEGTPRRAQYDLCVNFMVLRDFDLREATITGTIVNDNPELVRPLRLGRRRGRLRRQSQPRQRQRADECNCQQGFPEFCHEVAPLNLVS